MYKLDFPLEIVIIILYFWYFIQSVNFSRKYTHMLPSPVVYIHVIFYCLSVLNWSAYVKILFWWHFSILPYPWDPFCSMHFETSVVHLDIHPFFTCKCKTNNFFLSYVNNFSALFSDFWRFLISLGTFIFVFFSMTFFSSSILSLHTSTFNSNIDTFPLVYHNHRTFDLTRSRLCSWLFFLFLVLKIGKHKRYKVLYGFHQFSSLICLWYFQLLHFWNGIILHVHQCIWLISLIRLLLLVTHHFLVPLWLLWGVQWGIL